MKPFRAIVTHVDDVSKVMDVDSTTEKPDPVIVAKCAEFTLKSYRECPWPPSNLLGRRVVMMDEDAYIRFLSLARVAMEGNVGEHDEGLEVLDLI